MFEEDEERDERLRQPEPGHPVAGEDQGDPEGGPGSRKAEATPKIADDGNKEETQRPAPDDDVGVADHPGGTPDPGAGADDQ